MIKVTTPLTEETLSKLHAGDSVMLSGEIYTARDAAHKRLQELINSGQPIPFNTKGAAIYYVGPSPAKPGQIIGSAGPTTSYRMDTYTPQLLELGIKATIGKGQRSPEVIEAMKKYKAVYFAALGGTGALLSKKIKKNELVAFEDLGTEAIRKLTVEDFPVFVINDIYGQDFYKLGTMPYESAHHNISELHAGNSG